MKTLKPLEKVYENVTLKKKTIKNNNQWWERMETQMKQEWQKVKSY